MFHSKSLNSLYFYIFSYSGKASELHNAQYTIIIQIYTNSVSTIVPKF